MSQVSMMSKQTKKPIDLCALSVSGFRVEFYSNLAYQLHPGYCNRSKELRNQSSKVQRANGTRTNQTAFVLRADECTVVCMFVRTIVQHDVVITTVELLCSSRGECKFRLFGQRLSWLRTRRHICRRTTFRLRMRKVSDCNN